MDLAANEHIIPGPAEGIPDQGLDWVWPAIDIFTDKTIGGRACQTCSELGSQRIRLVKIRSGPPDSIIKLDTKICSLAHAGEYTALSYTWGSSVLQHQIHVDHQPKLVTTNLWRFLSQARRLAARFSGWLWVDALSIDQKDLWEKLEQVKIISRIFGHAERTAVWLGPAYGDSDRAMKVLDTASPSTSAWKSSRSLWAGPKIPAMRGLCERNYWRRLWVFQELKASRKVDLMCGNYHVGFERLRDFLFADRVDKRIQEAIHILQRSAAGTMIRLTRRSLASSLRQMLDETHHLHCADPLDRVYALLNVVGSGHEGIAANYATSVPELLNKVLSNMHELHAPRALSEVCYQCASLEVLFALERGSMYQVENTARAADSKPSTFLAHLGRLDWASFGEDVIVDLHRWCKEFGHEQISRLLHEYTTREKEVRQVLGEGYRTTR